MSSSCWSGCGWTRAAPRRWRTRSAARLRLGTTLSGRAWPLSAGLGRRCSAALAHGPVPYATLRGRRRADRGHGAVASRVLRGLAAGASWLGERRVSGTTAGGYGGWRLLRVRLGVAVPGGSARLACASRSITHRLDLLPADDGRGGFLPPILRFLAILRGRAFPGCTVLDQVLEYVPVDLAMGRTRLSVCLRDVFCL